MKWIAIEEGIIILLNPKIWLYVIAYVLIIHLTYIRHIKILLVTPKPLIVERLRKYIMFRSVLDTVMVTFITFFIYPILLEQNLSPTIDGFIKNIPILMAFILVVGGARMLWGIYMANLKSALNVNTVTSFFVCILLIYFLTNQSLADLGQVMKVPNNAYPSFGICLLFIVITLPTLLLFVALITLLSTVLNEKIRVSVKEMLITAIGILCGIMYMRMYCSYFVNTVIDANI